MDERERDSERAELKDLGERLFGAYISDIPEAYLRELKRCVDAATASLGLVVGDHDRVAYWLDGRSLGVLGCAGTSDHDIKRISGRIRQLDHITGVELTVNTHYDTGNQRVHTGRRLTIGRPDNPDIVLDASPVVFLPDKRQQIEQFIDQLLAALAGR
jgi:hypothetical protein